MTDGIRSQTNGVPTWTAAAGVQTFDPSARILYINMTNGAADWLAIDVSIFANAAAFEDLKRKFIQLIGLLNEQGIDGVQDLFQAEVDAAQELENEDDEDENIVE